MKFISKIINALAVQRQAEGVCHSVNTFLKGISSSSATALASIIIFIGTFSFACSENNLHFDTPNDAIGAYRGFLKEMEQCKMTNAKDFCQNVCTWQELTDSVYRFLVKDSVLKNNNRIAETFYEIHDSIRTQLMHLTETWKCSYSDVATIKKDSSPLRKDDELKSAVREAAPFFYHLDSIKTIQADKKEILQQYRAFLTDINKKGVKSSEELLSFISQEDILFRSFLEHLIEIDNDPVADITRMTEKICRDIFINAKNGMIPAKDAIIFMSMRTGRRLLQNSAVCVKDINSYKMNSSAQANAYLWMIIQPFISIDQLSIITMTDTDTETFKYIQEQLPKSTAFAKSFNIEQRALTYLLPQQLLKMYILSL